MAARPAGRAESPNRAVATRRIGPQVAPAALSVDVLNDATRGDWRGDAQPSATLGAAGNTQYRGYFAAGEERYAKASAGDVEQVLRHFGASTVVGHTLVDRVTSLHGGLVHAIDVNTDTAVPEVLLSEQGKAHIVNTGVRRNLNEGNETTVTGPLELTSARDWGIIGSQVHRTYQLARLPSPY